MKIPAECPGELNKEEKKKVKLQRQESARVNMEGANGSTTDVGGDGGTLKRSDTLNTLSSGFSAPPRTVSRSASGTSIPAAENGSSRPIKAAPAKHRMIAPPPAIHRNLDDDNGHDARPTEKKCRMLYTFQKNGDEEINVDEGQELVVLEDDDGTGWIRVRSGHESGLVPSSYVEMIPNHSLLSARPTSSYSASSASLSGSMHGSSSNQTSSNPSSAPAGKKKGPAVAPKRGAKKLKYVEAMYEYEARTDMEHSMKEGERFVLVSSDKGDGWAEVEKGGIVRSVPANYIQEI